MDSYFMDSAMRCLGGEEVKVPGKNTTSKSTAGSTGNELQRLRDENQRLKRTLQDRFEMAFE